MSWPAFNASLNALCALLLVFGYALIRTGHRRAHQVCMTAALCVSTVFLGSYLLYHAEVGSVRYIGQGAARAVYFTILISHSILAAVIVPMILRTFFLAWRQRWDAHRRWARWTLPLWGYVSVTGVVIYWMLYY